MSNLLIVRLSAMGDVIHSLLAAQVLRDSFPEAMIGWLIEERWAELLCAPGTARRGARSAQRPLADWVHAVKLRAWGKSLPSLHTAEQIVRAWNDVRSVRYEVAVDLQGAMRSALLARWSGAPVVYGAAQPRETPASLWYTRPVVACGTHVVEQNISIVEEVAGTRRTLREAEFPRHVESENSIRQRLQEAGIEDFAILNPGAGWGAKQWPAERYGEVARVLGKAGLCSIVNYGPGEESLAHEVEVVSAGAARALKCTVSELIALTRRAKIFIGGDTGPLHLAAALRVPVVAIFGPTDPARNGPYGTRSVVLRNPGSPTTHARRAQPDEAMLSIPIEAVVSAARALIADGGGQQCPPPSESAHG